MTRTELCEQRRRDRWRLGVARLGHAGAAAGRLETRGQAAPYTSSLKNLALSTGGT